MTKRIKKGYGTLPSWSREDHEHKQFGPAITHSMVSLVDTFSSQETTTEKSCLCSSWDSKIMKASH